MRIGNAGYVLSNYEARKDAAMSLAAGEPVSIAPASGDESDIAGATPHSLELVRDIAAGRAALTSVRIDDQARHELNRQGLVVGGGGGAIVGLGIGVLMEQWRSVHPASALIAEAACAAIGFGAGALIGSGTITMDVYYENGKLGALLQAPKP